ncbi:heavy metal-associated isoprenylated plant protein 26-like [Dioscorea cayenensis subsp. rotundata]|uniref:Heavy metal-associated isoprenylated plant protein 26-like n=1 Tax=Dioscorea cayennensis subsp. rotundata TaxID=55577 RepID=A0AB40AN85_DIOCR|nr:heavy metal-associated isoprenylated plant protein 26-like [Dioscorea cayenensis subsp. rotundata]
MGILDHVSELFSFEHNHHSKKRKQLQTVEIKVKMDCEGCERRVKKAVKDMKGVNQVEVNPKQNKLTVTGYVEPKKVLKRVRNKTGKHAEVWPYVPYDVVYHPYVAGAYDKKAPPGYVRNVLDDPKVSNLARASSMEERYSTAFSDENPNACTVM